MCKVEKGLNKAKGGERMRPKRYPYCGNKKQAELNQLADRMLTAEVQIEQLARVVYRTSSPSGVSETS